MNDVIDSWIRRGTVLAMVGLVLLLLGTGVGLLLPRLGPPTHSPPAASR